MKKTEEYIDISKLSYKSKTLQLEIIKNWIISAQKDTIEYTLQQAADNAGTKTNSESTSIIVDKDSILNLKSKLFEEIDNE